MTSNTPTPARPALDAMAMSEGDEPTPEAILIAAWKLRFNKAFRPEEEAGALMAFLDTVGLCVVSKRSLADMREIEQRARELLTAVKFAGESGFGPPGDRFPGYEARVPSEFVTNLEAALARSAPEGER